MQFALLLAAADASTLSSLRGGAAPTQLITSAGELQAAPIAEVVDGGAQMAVVASVGGKGAGRALTAGARARAGRLSRPGCPGLASRARAATWAARTHSLTPARDTTRRRR